MKSYRTILALLLIPACHFLSYGQAYKPLKVGDTIPDVTVKKIMNYDKQSARLSDFRGKFLILDFWAIWCVPCLRAFPKLDSLQKRYKEDLTILAVTNETQDQVKTTFRTVPSLGGLRIPTAVEDAVLNQLFPHTAVPHEVIIDRQGKVIAITDAESINTPMIEKLINKQAQVFYEKKSVMKFNYEPPLFADTTYVDKIKYYSVIGSYIPGLGGPSGRKGFKMGSGEADTTFYAVNAFGINLLRQANVGDISKVNEYTENRVIYKTKHPERFIKPKDQSLKVFEPWAIKNNISYSITVPASEYQTLYPRMKADIERYYKVKSSIRKLKVDCYVITHVDSIRLKATGTKRKFDQGSTVWTVQNLFMTGSRFGSSILQHINDYCPVPVVYEGGGNPKLSFDFVPYLNDFAKLQQELASKGITIIKARRKMNMLIIDDADY